LDALEFVFLGELPGHSDGILHLLSLGAIVVSDSGGRFLAFRGAL
jgi:hypothetical protein